MAPERLHARVNPVQELTFSSNTRDILDNATRDIDRFGLRDRLIVDTALQRTGTHCYRA
jgi:hypothetical protein